MKRLICFAALLSILTFACSLPGTATPVVVTPVIVTPVVVTVTPAPVQANVSCNELSFYLDPALGSGASCQTVPESADPNSPGFDLNPQYTKVTLQGYVLAGRFFDPQISVFPVERFSQLAPDVIPGRVSALQALIGGGAPGSGGLPLLPIFNAAQEIRAQYAVVSFTSGQGIRFLTQYSQYADPINNHELFYSFQGLTADGRYWISAILPISSPTLAEDSNTIPGGMTQEQFSNNFTTYQSDITTQLNAHAPDLFQPAIPALDALVASLTIH